MAAKTITALIAAGIALTGCTMPSYAPMHDQNVEQAAADRLYCKAIAEGMTPAQGGGFVYAQGSPQFVGATMGAYAIGGLIGAAVRQQQKLVNYDDCMIARGYTKQQTADTPTESDWTRGLWWGVNNHEATACDTPPPGITKRADWKLGCHSGLVASH